MASFLSNYHPALIKERLKPLGPGALSPAYHAFEGKKAFYSKNCLQGNTARSSEIASKRMPTKVGLKTTQYMIQRNTILESLVIMG